MPICLDYRPREGLGATYLAGQHEINHQQVLENKALAWLLCHSTNVLLSLHPIALPRLAADTHHVYSKGVLLSVSLLSVSLAHSPSLAFSGLATAQHGID